MNLKRKTGASGRCVLAVVTLLIAAMFLSACGTTPPPETTVAATTTAAATTAAATEAAATEAAVTEAAATEAATTAKATEAATTTAATTTAATETQAAEVNANPTDVSDLPDWAGKQLTLRVWNGHGTGDAIRYSSSNDVVSPEIKRLFGITLDPDESFDNGGQDLASKLAVLAATSDFPEIGYNVINDDLIAGDKLYDLTELIPLYCPNINAFMKQYASRTLNEGYQNTGRHYSVFMNVGNNADSIRSMYPDADMERYSNIASPTDTMGSLSYLSVRDDILKLMYPGAKSQDEIEALYVKNGTFTRDEVYDVPIKSRQDVIDFFYLMKKVIDDNNITEDGKPVYPLGVFQGGDNWALLSWLRNLMDGKADFDYFTIFNLQSKHIEIGFKAGFFKDDVKVFNQMVRDGVASESSLIENNEIYLNKLNNGEYATGYAYYQPDLSQQAAAGKPWRFRKVYFDIPQDLTATIPQKSEIRGWDQLSIFKDKVAEDDVPQILGWLDFMYTDLGQKLICWGPRSAGLWEETGGVRRFTNKEIEDSLVYNVDNGANIKYNLATTRLDLSRPMSYPSLYIGIQGGGLNAPRYVYDLSVGERSPGGADSAFNTGVFEPQRTAQDIIVNSAHIWSFSNAIPDIKRFWDVRATGFEPLLTKCLAAQSDDEFEKAYQDMLDFADQNGLNDTSVAECEKYLQDNFPQDWNNYLLGY